MSSDKITILSIQFYNDRPTDLAAADLFTWVIWQYPEQAGQFLCGAVRPPIAKHRWLPALISPRKNLIRVYGYVDSHFTMPEQALNWLLKLGA